VTENNRITTTLLFRQPGRLRGLENVPGELIKAAARFWFGTASNKMTKDERMQALATLFQDRNHLQAGLNSLSGPEKQVLAIFKLYGGVMSGTLLKCEVLARGLAAAPQPTMRYSRRPSDDPVDQLAAKMCCQSIVPGYPFKFDWFHSVGSVAYPELLVHPAVLDLIKPIEPLGLAKSDPAKAPASPNRRPAAATALDLTIVAEALDALGSWPIKRSGEPAGTVRKRLARAFVPDEKDPLIPPDPAVLYYELLRQLGTLLEDRDEATLDRQAVQRHLCSPGDLQAWHWVRAWMSGRLWHDGVGAASEPRRGLGSLPVALEKREQAREVLVWGLARVARGDNQWLDLETFLADLWEFIGNVPIRLLGKPYRWQPNFARPAAQGAFIQSSEQRRANWLAGSGVWAANAIMVTLAHLGLVERGGDGHAVRYCFRLTDLGRAVFGAPAQPSIEPGHEHKFLVIQPNFEILAYLDGADVAAIWPLAAMARRTSSSAEHIQTFALSADSVYRALEAGMSAASIHQFLQRHGKNAVPNNVAQTLTEWARRRESLVIRTNVILAAAPKDKTLDDAGLPEVRRIGEHYRLLTQAPTFGPPGWSMHDLDRFQIDRPLAIDDVGRIEALQEISLVARARLAQFTEPVAAGWRIVAASIRRARQRGLTLNRIRSWLEQLVTNDLPAIVETMIENWAGLGERVFLGRVVMLQVSGAACAALRASPQFDQFYIAHLPPDWFIIAKDKQQEIREKLEELGFQLSNRVELQDHSILVEPDEEPAASRPRKSQTGVRERGRVGTRSPGE
jgi:hypothetical protein